MKVVIIDYGSGNLRSAANAFEHSAHAISKRARVVVTPEASALADASHIVLPGVGAFADCLAGLTALPAMVDALEDAVIRAGKPFLGICVGMQLMAMRGREYGVHEGLGWVAGEVVPLGTLGGSRKIPHMGWNDLALAAPPHPVFAGIESGRHAYFVHSYHFVCDRPQDVVATVDYESPVVAAIGRENIVGTQFHPEKSQRVGLRLIENFLRWRP